MQSYNFRVHEWKQDFGNEHKAEVVSVLTGEKVAVSCGLALWCLNALIVSV